MGGAGSQHSWLHGLGSPGADSSLLVGRTGSQGGVLWGPGRAEAGAGLLVGGQAPRLIG